MFESMGGGQPWHPEVTAGRYHLTLASAGRPVMQGWWAVEATARDQLPVWVGKWGTLPGARVTLVDEETGTVLTTWPEELQPSAILPSMDHEQQVEAEDDEFDDVEGEAPPVDEYRLNTR